MSITPDGWFDWAERDPGPMSRTNGFATNPYREGTVPHSAEGYRHYNRKILMGQVRDPRTGKIRNASWNTEVLIAGPLIQYYPLTVACWTSSSDDWNDRFWTTELEGTTPRHGKASPAQVATLWRMWKEYQEWSGVLLARDSLYLERTVHEHNENKPHTQTACPSGRYDDFYEEWDGYMAGLLEDLMLAVASGSEEQMLDREQRVTNARHRIGEIADGIRQSALEQGRSAAANVKSHEQQHEIAGSRIILPHKHVPGDVERD